MLRYKALRYKVLLPLVVLLLGACSNAPTFETELNPDTLTIAQGQSGTATLKITPKNGFKGTVSLSLVKKDGTAAPEGFVIYPSSVDVNGSDPVQKNLTIFVLDNAPTSTYELKVRATSDNITKDADLKVTVTQPSGS